MTLVDKKRILVVEDDPEMIKLHRDFLSESYTIIHKPDGKNTIRYLKENRNIHLAIIDYKLPDMSGLEVLKEIKKIMPSVPAIFITGHGNEDVAVMAFRCGARDYVKKPFVYEELMKRIAFCLSLNSTRERRAVRKEPEKITSDMFPSADAAKKNYYVQQACRYIQNNYSTDITLNQAASTRRRIQISFFPFIQRDDRFNLSKLFKPRKNKTSKELIE